MNLQTLFNWQHLEQTWALLPHQHKSTLKQFIRLILQLSPHQL
jgi:hypothetical protein